MKAVDAWLFDLGNVVMGIDFDRALGHWADAAGCDADDLRQRFHFDEAYERHERGEIDAQEYFASLRSLLSIDLTDDQLAEGWNAIYTGLIAEVASLLPALARSRPLYAFTNTNFTHHRAWAALSASTLEPFERVFLSCSMGLRKPEADAFVAVAKGIGAPLERILFFDDTQENVIGAQAAGMGAVLVRSPQDVIDAVTPYLAVSR
jgi:HAD superfamily hydrolase (TIGR01509 family)